MKDIIVNKEKVQKAVIHIDEIDWSRIGYSKRPECITRAIDLARDMERNWDSNKTNLDSFFNKKDDNGAGYKYTEVIFLPSGLDFSKVTSMRNCFYKNIYLERIPELNTIRCTDFTSAFSSCERLRRIEGLSFKSMGSMGNYPHETYSNTLFNFISYDGCPLRRDYERQLYNTTCRYMLIKDIGTNYSCTCLFFSDNFVWGINSNEVPDARQSLVDSLLTYSFDRRAAGYSDCTLILYEDVYNILTKEEIADIEAKGYILYGKGLKDE